VLRPSFLVGRLQHITKLQRAFILAATVLRKVIVVVWVENVAPVILVNKFRIAAVSITNREMGKSSSRAHQLRVWVAIMSAPVLDMTDPAFAALDIARDEKVHVLRQADGVYLAQVAHAPASNESVVSAFDKAAAMVLVPKDQSKNGQEGEHDHQVAQELDPRRDAKAEVVRRLVRSEAQLLLHLLEGVLVFRIFILD
jgi:hypothetical protein